MSNNKKKSTQDVVKTRSKKEDVIVEEEKFFDEKNCDKKSIAKTIFDIVFWVAILFLVFVWIVDFVRVKKSESPKFCIAKSEYKCENDDATVEVCTGLGYKVYAHTLDDVTMREFRPWFTKYKEVE